MRTPEQQGREALLNWIDQEFLNPKSAFNIARVAAGDDFEAKRKALHEVADSGAKRVMEAVRRAERFWGTEA